MSKITALELFKLLNENPQSMIEVRIKVVKTVKIEELGSQENISIDDYAFVNADMAPDVPPTGKRGRPHDKYIKYIKNHTPKNKPFCVHKKFYNALIRLGYKTKNIKIIDDLIYVKGK